MQAGSEVLSRSVLNGGRRDPHSTKGYKDARCLIHIEGEGGDRGGVAREWVNTWERD